ncbi:Hypothetical predicted protein [Pelobates cultripes]|uniref:Uncharacterized protein n=1 Tax=Pelobates cultripes TaxID=61616 RepID=A0AAD1SF80_PELCU|nr:Hypothetical predicted protein [Pelobates cultripes]
MARTHAPCADGPHSRTLRRCPALTHAAQMPRTHARCADAPHSRTLRRWPALTHPAQMPRTHAPCADAPHSRTLRRCPALTHPAQMPRTHAPCADGPHSRTLRRCPAFTHWPAAEMKKEKKPPPTWLKSLLSEVFQDGKRSLSNILGYQDGGASTSGDILPSRSQGHSHRITLYLCAVIDILQQ